MAVAALASTGMARAADLPVKAKAQGADLPFFLVVDDRVTFSYIFAGTDPGQWSRRADGSYSPYVTIWGVRSGDGIYIRSAHGPENGWFRRAKERGTGRIRTGSTEHDVQFTEAAPDDPAVDRAYHAKYDSFGQQYVGPVTGPSIPTLQVTPADNA